MSTPKNSIIVLLVIFILQATQFQIYAQESEASKFRFGIESSIGISDRFNIGETDFSGFLVNYLLELEQPKVGFEFGGVFDIAISENLSIGSGVKSVQLGFKSKKTAPLITGDYDFFRLEERNTFIEIPLKFSYYRNLKKGRFYFSIGYSPMLHIATHQITTLYYGDREEVSKVKDEVRKFRKINLVGEFGIGYENSLSKNLVLSLSPTFKIHSFSFLDDETVELNRRLFFYGISVGLMFISK